MPDHSLRRTFSHSAARQFALPAGLAVMIVTGALWLAAITAGSDHANAIVVWGGAAAVVSISVAVALCVHYASAARSWRATAVAVEGAAGQWERAVAETAR